MSPSTLADLADLVFPRRCVGCDSHLGLLCPRCVPVVSPFRAGGDVWAAVRYEGAARAALLAYKERGRRDLTRPLAGLLAHSVAAAIESAGRGPPVVLVCVPSERRAAARRGGDHVLRLARHAAGHRGLRVVADALRLARPVRDSAGLTSDERSQNLAGAMVARPASPARRAVLVDDIVTTGSTLREARRALEAASWQVLGTAVVAATPLRSG